MTDIHADAPAKDVTRPADRGDIARLDGRIDRSEERTEDRIARAIEGIRAEIWVAVEPLRADIGRVQQSVDEVRKDVHALNEWKWAAGGIIGLAVLSSPVIATLILRGFPV